jgi:hypothetical protein
MPGISLRSEELKELTAKAYKYDRLSSWLKEYINDPDDETDVMDLCVRAGSDDTLDEVMDMAGVDTLDDLHEKIKKWRGDPQEGDDNIFSELERLRNSNEFTDDRYWDCKCDGDCVHSKSELTCEKCGTGFDNDDPDIPDSHRTEVISHLLKKLSKAEIACAMDVLMHHLNDENAIEPWLINGIPDGLNTDILNPRAGKERLSDYIDYGDMPDNEFEDLVKLFATIVRNECFKVRNGKFEYQRKGFC